MAYSVAFADTVSKEIIWQDFYDDIELVAGMVAAGLGIIADLHLNANYSHYTVETNADISYYRALSDVPEENVNTESCGILQPGEYGMWSRGQYFGYYNLFRFTGATFVQGFVSMGTAFRADFRNYMYGIIFDSNMKKHVLAGYIFSPYRIAIDVPDLNDVDEEEADDENIIEPLHKDW